MFGLASSTCFEAQWTKIMRFATKVMFLRLFCTLFLGVATTALAADPARWQPSVGQSWDWQLVGPYDFTVPVDIVDIDQQETNAATVAELHAQGKRVVCYIDVGSWESWRPDAGDFPAAIIGNDYDGWAGEKWLDIRAIAELEPILEARLDDCAAKGFDGIEPDNIDGFENNTGFPLTAADQLVFNRWLAARAHERGLSIGLKNDNGQVADLLDDFDWALTEDCFAQGWCSDLAPFIAAGKPVLSAEYTDENMSLSKICAPAAQLGFAAILKERDLNRFLRVCPQPSSVVASLLPTARSGDFSTPVTAFATMINVSASETASNCSILLPTGFPGEVRYQRTDPASNVPIGLANTSFSLAPAASQSLVFSFLPHAGLQSSQEIYLLFDCENTNPAAHYVGLSTFHFSQQIAGQSADMITVLATTSNDGIVEIPVTGTHFFTAAAINANSGATTQTLTAEVNDDLSGLPLAVTVCETDENSICKQPASSNQVTFSTNGGKIVLLAIFVTANDAVDFDPALHRLHLQFKDSNGQIRGAASVAVRTR
jgi:hypothetical protein